VLERGEHVSFANYGLPYYAGGSIEQRDALLLQTPESPWSRFRLDVRTRPEVLGVDRATREVTVRRPGGTVGTVGTEGYDVLVLGPGARPIVPEIPGVERALVLRDVSDVDRVVAGLRSGARSAVIVGGGFIGVEMAEQLRHRGLDVTLVELADQVLAPLDPEMAAPVLAELQAHGVDVRLGEQVTKLLPDTGGPRLRRHRAGRPRPVQVRFGEEEFAAIELAAGRAGLTPTGYVGAVALAAARGTVPPAPSQSREALTELMAARAQVRRFGGNVNQHHCRRSCGRSRTATRCLHSPAGPGHQARAALKVIADSASGWCGRAGSLPAFSHRCSSPPWSDSATRPRPAWAHRVRLRDA